MQDEISAIVGETYVLTGSDTAKWSRDFVGKYQYTPLAVVRPANTAQVSEIMKLANRTNTPVVPISGNTGLWYVPQIRRKYRKS